MKDILEYLSAPQPERTCQSSLSAELEYFIGGYFVAGEGDLYRTIYDICYDKNADREHCVRLIPENHIGYVYFTNDCRFAFIIESAFGKFAADTEKFGIICLPVSALDSREFFIGEGELPPLLKKVTWIDDDFLDDERLEFDFEAFEQIDGGTKYINPKHFSANELINYLKEEYNKW